MKEEEEEEGEGQGNNYMCVCVYIYIYIYKNINILGKSVNIHICILAGNIYFYSKDQTIITNCF